METLWQDIKYGTRLLARSPGFTMVVIAILGIGIGGTTAMLSAIDAAMFRPCPYRDSERLAWLGETDSGRRYGEMVSLPNFHDWREQSHSFEQLAAVGHRGCTVRDAGRTEKSDAILVSEGFFSVLGVQPLLGRLFLPNEETLGGQRAVILSEGQWQRWFARDPNAIGRMLVIDKVPHTVVGVLPGEFHWIFRRDCGLWLSMAIEPTDETHRGSRGSDVIGRLKPGITVDQAQAEMDVIADRLAHTHAETLRDVGVLVVPMREAYRTAVGRSGNVRVLMILLGIVASVLLMACLHVAGLLLARAAAREKEIAVRTALGADRLRLVRQLLAESVLLAGLGGGAGLLLAHWGVRLLATVGGDLTGLIPWFVEPRVDSRTLLYALGVSLATCGLFGALPAVWISRVNPGRFLTAGRTGGQGPRLNRLRAVLVTGDLAIAFVLLVMAALIINTYVRILDFRSGIDARNVLAIEIDADTGSYSVPERRSAFFQQVLEQIRRLPGVGCAATANATPAWTGYNYSIFRLDDRRGGDEGRIIRRTSISPEYFTVLRIPLLKGRTFTEHEAATGAAVAIVNESLAARSWPGEDPIGRRILRMKDASQGVSCEIVGVVADVNHYFHFRLARISGEDRKKYVGEFSDDVVYVPGYDGALMVRALGDPLGMAGSVRRAIFTVDQDAVPSGVVSLQDDIDALFWLQRFNTFFLGAFAAVTLLLGSMGVYGVVAYSVSRRTHDIGIRMVLGARAGTILKTVLWEGLAYTSVGLALGLVAAMILTRLIAGLLYEVPPTDPLTFVCAALVLTGVALLACYLPARRAARIDPMTALRCE